VAEIRVPQIDLKRQHAALRAELLEATERVLTSAWFIMGPEGRALEEELAAASGARYGVGLNSGPMPCSSRSGRSTSGPATR
jgi:dTDP-4-amino-4,6-dideoxygalactose transaminase